MYIIAYSIRFTSVHHNTVDSFYPFPPPHPLTVTCYYACVCVFGVFGLVWFFIYFVFFFVLCSTYGWNCNSIWLSLSDLFHFSIMPSDLLMLMQIARFHLFYAWSNSSISAAWHFSFCSHPLISTQFVPYFGYYKSAAMNIVLHLLNYYNIGFHAV